MSIALLSGINSYAKTVPQKSIYPFADTIQPPPNHPDSITGQVTSCTGDTSLYQADIPVSCTAQWYVNNVLQTSTADTLQVVWQQPGTNNISLYFNCDGNIMFYDSLTVETGAPPVVDLGNDTVINQGDTLVLDAGNPGSEYRWSTGDTTQTITVTTTGYYSVSVKNDCGTGSDTLFVDVYDFTVNRNVKHKIRIVSAGNRIVIKPGKSTVKSVVVCGLDGKIYYRGKYENEIALHGKEKPFIIKIVFADGTTYGKLFFK